VIYDPQWHHRRTIHLKGYDYAQPSAYFVTICTQDRACLFGEVVDGQVRLNDAGRMVQRWWDELNRKFPHIRTDAFVVMPNHIHGIVVIEPVEAKPVGADLRVCPDNESVCPDNESGAGEQLQGADVRLQGAHIGAPLQGRPDDESKPVGADLRVCPDNERVCPGIESGADGQLQGARIGAPLSEIVRWFKTMTTNDYIRGVKQYGWTPFYGRLWQRNYYEHIVRDEASLEHVRQYIEENPLHWSSDPENPSLSR
jgi:REP element-mobilizing transposase RayT